MWTVPGKLQSEQVCQRLTPLTEISHRTCPLSLPFACASFYLFCLPLFDKYGIIGRILVRSFVLNGFRLSWWSYFMMLFLCLYFNYPTASGPLISCFYCQIIAGTRDKTKWIRVNESNYTKVSVCSRCIHLCVIVRKNKTEKLDYRLSVFQISVSPQICF